MMMVKQVSRAGTKSNKCPLSLAESKSRKTDFVPHKDKVEKIPSLSDGQTNIYYYVIYTCPPKGWRTKYITSSNNRAREEQIHD